VVTIAYKIHPVVLPVRVLAVQPEKRDQNVAVAGYVKCHRAGNPPIAANPLVKQQGVPVLKPKIVVFLGDASQKAQLIPAQNVIPLGFV